MNGMSDFEKELAKDIREIRKDQRETRREVSKIDKKLAVQKAKSGLLGATGGAGVVGIAQLWDFIKAYMDTKGT